MRLQCPTLLNDTFGNVIGNLKFSFQIDGVHGTKIIRNIMLEGFCSDLDKVVFGKAKSNDIFWFAFDVTMQYLRLFSLQVAVQNGTDTIHTVAIVQSYNEYVHK